MPIVFSATHSYFPWLNGQRKSIVEIFIGQRLIFSDKTRSKILCNERAKKSYERCHVANCEIEKCPLAFIDVACLFR